jgi:hypothetical protein
MGNRVWFTRRNTRQFGAIVIGLARRTRVLDFFSLFFGDYGDRLFAKRIVRVFAGLENAARTRRHAVAAAVALVSVDGDKEVAGTVRVTVIRFHSEPPFA